MDRRSFLKTIGVGAAVAAVEPKTILRFRPGLRPISVGEPSNMSSGPIRWGPPVERVQDLPETPEVEPGWAYACVALEDDSIWVWDGRWYQLWGVGKFYPGIDELL